MIMPRVSVVMTVYNAERFLQEAIESVLAQTFIDFEFIIVDDASTDSSLEILEKLKDPRILIIKHTSNRGAANSRNDAMMVACGDYIAIMDADDLSHPHRFERQVEFLDKYTNIGLVGCSIYDNIDVDNFILYTSYLPEDNATIQKTLMEKWCFLHPSVMFRRQVVERVGGYRETFDVAEDHDFILRVSEHYNVHNMNEKLVSYRINPKGLSVVAQDYINEQGMRAIRLARERRQGRDEKLEIKLQKMIELKHRRNASGCFLRILQGWKNSFYASDRYYGFGCKALYVGNCKQARACFARSINNNCLFVKSWFCLFLSFLPFSIYKQVRFVFRSSAQYHEELDKQFSK